MSSSTVTNPKPTRRTIPSPQGRDEMNLVEFPFATLSHKTTLGSIKCVRWIAGAEMIKVKGYTRMRFLKDKGVSTKDSDADGEGQTLWPLRASSPCCQQGAGRPARP